MNLDKISQNKDNIYYNPERINQICNKWRSETLHIITDFDKTLTSGNSEGTWSLLAKSGYMPQSYIESENQLYEEYRPIELDTSLSEGFRMEKMKEWAEKALVLIKEYKVSESMVESIVKNPYLLSFRKDEKEFFKTVKNRNIPIVIISAGIGNFIKGFLEYNNCLSENIEIVSNFLSFENGFVSGFSSHIIHSANKDEHELPEQINNKIKDRPDIVLMGDTIDDVKMVPLEKRADALKVGFLDERIENNINRYQDAFDIVCTHNSSLEFVTDIIKKYT